MVRRVMQGTGWFRGMAAALGATALVQKPFVGTASVRPSRGLVVDDDANTRDRLTAFPKKTVGA